MSCGVCLLVSVTVRRIECMWGALSACLSCVCSSMSIADACMCNSWMHSILCRVTYHKKEQPSREAARGRWYKRDHASFKGIWRRRQQPTPKAVCTPGGAATDGCQSVTSSWLSECHKHHCARVLPCHSMSQHAACLFACHRVWCLSSMSHLRAISHVRRSDSMSHLRARLVCVHVISHLHACLVCVHVSPSLSLSGCVCIIPRPALTQTNINTYLFTYLHTYTHAELLEEPIPARRALAQ